MNILRHASFTTKILLGIFIPLILVCFTLSFYLIQRIDEDSIRRVDEKGITVNKLLAKISVVPLLTYDYWSIEDYIKEIVQDKEVIYAVIYDAEGKPITHTSTRPATVNPDAKAYTAPIYGHNEVIGKVEVGISTRRYQQEIKKDFLVVLAMVAVTVAFGFFLALLIARAVTRPVRDIARIMEQAKEGDFTVRAETKNEDEIGALVAGFNEMLAHIQLRDEELARYRGHLEEEVQARTAELANANELLKVELHERQIAEETAHRSHLFAQTVLNSMSDAICIIDINDHRIIDANRVFIAQSGLPLAQLTQMKCYQVHHHGDVPCNSDDCDCPLAKMERTGDHASTEHTHWHDGQEVYIEVSVSPIKDGQGRLINAVHICRDITERKRAQKALQTYAEELEQRTQEVQNFAYIVSHDLRAPLVSIMGFTGELEESIRLIGSMLERCHGRCDEAEWQTARTAYSEDIPEALKYISSSVQRMESLIKAVLSLSRIGKQVLNPEPVNMENLVGRILDSLAHQVEKKHVAVEVSPLPEIVADRLAMEQVMGNLIDNALKYLAPDRHGELQIYAESREEATIFHIRDNGRGIAKEDLPKVFELFRRVGKQDCVGDGMGLAYVQTLVRRHRGRIWCDSEAGTGSVFSFSLPRE